MLKTLGGIIKKDGQMKRTYKFLKVLVSLAMIFTLFKGAYADNEKGLPLKLLATVIDKDFAQSTCVIMDMETRTQASCKTLDKIAGFQITKITRGTVKLLKDGKVFSLDFPLGNENVANYSESITIRRQTVLEKISPSLLLTEARPLPIVQAGKILGFKIPALKDESLLKMAGLAAGDIATKINGENLDSIPKALQLYNKFKNQGQINLEIQRGDAVLSLNYFIN
jgi:type II secretion system protein C